MLHEHTLPGCGPVEREGDEVPGEISKRDSGNPKEHNGSGEDSGEASGGVPHVEQ